MVYHYLAFWTYKFTYYGPFDLGTGSAIASGLGYNGLTKDGHQWDKVVLNYALNIELATSPVLIAQNWNH